ncbi:MAG: hypothetical protein VW338_07650, partial [Rhodospirillaceae bacterium]
MTIAVKICGLTRPEDVDAAVEAGADMVGFVFFPASPRAVTPEAAARLATRVRKRIATCASPWARSYSALSIK